jgi:two-component system alkaline phosphatase synthesis response regulator PhoP
MPNAPRVLLVEDDPGLQMTMGDRLTQEGYTVEVVGSGEKGLERAKAQAFDLVLLDVMLPTMSGFDVCVALRQAGMDVPILRVTARGQLGDRVAGLKLGADDYLVKPFEMAELLARVEARVRRTPARPAPHVYRFGEITVDTRRGAVERCGRSIDMGAKEYRLLCYFLEREGRALPREELLEQVWGYKAETASRTLDVHVSGLRRKIERHPHQPAHLLTVHGLGYKFVS